MPPRGKGSRPSPKSRHFTAPSGASVDELLGRATRHHRAGELEPAEKLCDQILALAPERADVLHLRGLVALQKGHTSIARGLLARAVARAPSSVAYRVNLANALRLDGDSGAAVSLLLEVVEHARAEPMVYAALARAYEVLGDLENAAAHSRRAAELDPSSFVHLATAGSFLRRCGEPAEARVMLERALAVAEARALEGREVATTSNDLGLVLEALGDPDGARPRYRKATELDPAFAEAFNNMGRLLHDAADYRGALLAFEQALTLGGERAAIESNIGSTLRATGAMAEAEECCRRAVDIRPAFASAHNNLGNVLRDRGRLDDAAASYLRAIELDSRFALAHSNLGSLCRQRGDYVEAVRVFTTARELDPRLRTAYLALSWLLPTVGRVDELPALFAEWHRCLPDDPIAQHMRAATADGSDVPARASSDYVTALFDDFARAFDTTLERLGYGAPQMVAGALANVFGSAKRRAILDAGCGTGLCGPLLRPLAERLDGVDLSEGMLARARERGVYDHLERAELVEFLVKTHDAYDAIAAADLLIYFGKIEELLLGFAHAARRGAYVCFTIENHGDPNAFRLMPHGRYCHGRAYVCGVLDTAGLSVVSMQDVILREELGQPAAGTLIMARATS